MFKLKGLLFLAHQPSLHDKRTSAYLQSISFISSIGFALAVGAAIALGTASSVLGFQLNGDNASPNPKLSAVGVQSSTEFFVAAATAYGLALVSSVATQAVQAFTEAPSHSHKERHYALDFISHTCVFVVVWGPPMLIIIATLFVGCGLALFDLVLGCILQGGILASLSMIFISQGAGYLAVFLMMVTLPLMTFFLFTVSSIQRVMWPIFVLYIGLLFLAASLSAFSQLKLSRELLTSTHPQPQSIAYSPMIQNDIEHSAGLNSSPKNTPEAPQQRQMNLEAITTQLSFLVHAVEQLAAQNARASALPTSPTTAAAPTLPVEPSRPDNPEPCASADVELLQIVPAQ